MAFNWGRAFQGATMGALQGYSSIQQGQMEKEWEIEKQRIAEEREKSLYEWKQQQKLQDPEYIAQQKRLDAQEARAEKGLTMQEEQLGIARRTAERQDRAFEFEMSGPVMLKDERGDIVTVSRSEAMDMVRSGTHRQLNSIEMAEQASIIEMDLKERLSDKEFESTLRKADRIVAEAAKLGIPEEEQNKLKLQLITGVKEANNEGIKPVEVFKAYQDSYNKLLENNLEATPEQRGVLWEQAVNSVNASFEAANIRTGRTALDSGEKITPIQVAAEAIAEGLHESPNWESQIQQTYPAPIATAIIQEMRGMIKEDESEKRQAPTTQSGPLRSPEVSTPVSDVLGGIGRGIRKQFTIPPPPGANKYNR